MARIRPLVLVGVIALTGAFVAGPAQADSPEVFSGEAAGTALELSVLGKQATFGQSAAKVNSAGLATGAGAGQALPNTELVVPSTDATDAAAVDEVLAGYSSKQVADAKSGEKVDKPRVCQSPELPPELAAVVNVGLVCSSARADNGNHPSASAEGSVAEADVHLETVIEILENESPVELPIGDTLATVLGEVCTAAGATPTTQGPVCDATTTVKELVQTVLKTQTLDIELGKSTSSVTTGPSTVTSEATAAGATIKILPTPLVGGVVTTEPVVTISIADAKAKTVYDRGSGTATGKADPALVRIAFNDVMADLLGRDEVTVDLTLLPKLAPITVEGTSVVERCDDDRAICVLKGSPFESRIYLASGSTKVNPDGSAKAVADAVRVDLLMGITEFIADTDKTGTFSSLGLSDPGVHLALAHAEAAVGGRQANIAPPKEDKKTTQELPRSGDEPPLELPRTGGTPWVPMLGAAGLALAVLLRKVALKATR